MVLNGISEWYLILERTMTKCHSMDQSGKHGDRNTETHKQQRINV